MLKTTDYYPTKTTVLLSHHLGGQFEPVSGGQFKMAEGGQFVLAEGGQFAWVFQYDTNMVHFAEPKEQTLSEKKAIAQRYFDIWFYKGSNFLDFTTPDVISKDIKIAAFLLHQAAESFYYSTLLVFTEYKPKTHNLKKLRKQSKILSEQLFLLFPIETDKNFNHLFDLLKRGYIDARYRADYTITTEEIYQLVELLNEMRRIVEVICKGRMNELDL